MARYNTGNMYQIVGRNAYFHILKSKEDNTGFYIRVVEKEGGHIHDEVATEKMLDLLTDWENDVWNTGGDCA